MIQMTPQYSTVLFSDVFTDADQFTETILNVNSDDGVGEVDLGLLYLLLAAKYGNNPIANNDINQFILKVWSITYQYGPAWNRKLSIQKEIRDLTPEQIMQGNKAIYNHAFNPSSAPSTSTLTELDHINDQSTANTKRGILEGYNMVLELLDTNFTEEFLRKYQPLFKQFVMPENPLLFITEGEE